MLPRTVQPVSIAGPHTPPPKFEVPPAESAVLASIRQLVKVVAEVALAPPPNWPSFPRSVQSR